MKVVAYFDKVGVHPARLRIDDKEGQVVVKVDRVLKKDMGKLAGNPKMVFICESVINGLLKQYEVKYELSTMKWILFKI